MGNNFHLTYQPIASELVRYTLPCIGCGERFESGEMVADIRMNTIVLKMHRECVSQLVDLLEGFLIASDVSGVAVERPN